MIQRLRWWIVRKLIGRSSVMANVYMQKEGDLVEISIGPGLLMDNHIVGDFHEPMVQVGWEVGGATRIMSKALEANSAHRQPS